MKASKSKNERVSFVQRFAAFGDSEVSVVASFALLLLAVAIHHQATLPDEEPFSNYASLGPIPSIQETFIHTVVRHDDTASTNKLEVVTTDDMREEYARDGVVCIRGLINEELLRRLDAESSSFVDESRRRRGTKRKGTQFHTEEHSAIFHSSAEFGKAENTLATSAFMDVALFSNVAKAATELLLAVTDEEEKDTKDNLRVVRDIFLAKDEEQFVCGWHTDDFGFWPATPESPGINAWIALDDMTNTEENGGFALAVQSDRAPWTEAAQIATGASSVHFPPQGFASAKDMLERRTGLGTCNLRQAAPHIDQRMEETSRIYPVQRGDVVFHTRWLFHRTVAVERPTSNDKVYRRYSIRYGPGSKTVVPPGYGTELSVLSDSANGGRSLNEVNAHDGPWYPQAWPPLPVSANHKFLQDFLALKNERLPIAMERRKLRVKELKLEARKRHRSQQKQPR